MIERLRYGWTMRRVLYLVMGAIFVWFFLSEKQYMGAAVGALFFAMALFNMGCAAGNCSTGLSRKKPEEPVDFTQVNYEEIK